LKTIRVEAPSQGGSQTHTLELRDDCSNLFRLLGVLHNTDWGRDLIDLQGCNMRLRPNLLLVLNRRMMQPWELAETEILDGQEIQLIPIVPGG
jgi:hypothetical protein